MAGQATVHINVGALNRFINRTVQPYLRTKAEEIASEARRRAPVGATDNLKNSIVVRQGFNGGVRVEVQADYAGYVSQGTGPRANPAQANYYPRLRRRGLILWSDSKNVSPYAVAKGIAAHGTPANPFFEEAIATVLNRYNFRWIRKDLVK
jgi:hypothetical protein